MRALLFLLPLLPAMPVAAQASVRYKFESTTKTTMDVSAMAAALGVDEADLTFPGQDKPVTAFALFTVTTRDSAGGKLLHILIDSITTGQAAQLAELGESLPPEVQAMMGSGKGGTVDLFIVDGKHKQAKLLPAGNLEVATLAGVLPLIFPEFKSGSKVGDSWADTLVVDTAVTVMGQTATPKSRTITTWKMPTADSLTGSIAATTTMSMSEQESSETTSEGTARLRLDAARTVSEAVAITEGSMRIVMGNMGSMTTKTSITQTITRLP